MSLHQRPSRYGRIASVLAAAAAATNVAIELRAQQQPLTGAIGAHDPSSVIKDGSNYFVFTTGGGIGAKWSADGVHWNEEPSGVFAAPPAWTSSIVGFDGFFWAPDVLYWNGQYHLYYSVSTWGSKRSAIGVATSPTLNRTSPNYGWTDHGMVVESDWPSPFNAIDPSLLEDPTGRVWMTWGSFNNGIYVTEIDRDTSKPLAGRPSVNVAAPGPTPEIEGASMTYRDGFYYLFANWGGCCAGVDSTYNIRVGRSTSPTGLFLDKNGVNMLNGGGTLFLDDDSNRIGPGHFERFVEGGQEYFSYHYYNGDVNGAPTLGMRELHWNSGWPSASAVNPDWRGQFSEGWGLATNWHDGVVPNGVGHVANFGGLSAARTFVTLEATRTVGKVNFHHGGPNFTIGNTGQTLILDADAGESARINVLGGTQTIDAPVNAVDHLGVNVVANGAVQGRLNLGNVTAKGLTKYGHGTLALNGMSTFSEPVLARWGALEINGVVTANAFASIGHAFAETASMTVRGTGSFTANSDLNIGDNGNGVDPATGTLFIHDDANVTISSTGGFYVGSGFSAGAKANGTVTQTGGTLNANSAADGAFVIGGRNSSLATGIYNLSGGTLNANTNVRVGGLSAGTFNQTGGTFNAAGFISVGRLAGATGTLNVSGGTLNQTNSLRAVIVGEAGAGTLNVSGAGHVSAVNPLRIGVNATGAGVVNLDGGAITARAVSRGSGTATFNFNGGTLRANIGNTTFMQGLTNAYVKAGGAIIDSNAFNVTIAQSLQHDPGLGDTLDGGLTKLGAGTLTLTGNNTYTGGTVVRAGALHVSAGTTGVATPPGLPDVNVEIAPANADDAAVTVSGAATLNADRVIVAGNSANNAGGTATLTQTGGTIDASLWFAVGSVGSGTFNMSDGVLNQNSSGVTQTEVAVFGSGNSVANISGNARINILNSGNFSIGVVDNSGSGTVNQTGGNVTFYSDAAGTTPGGSGNVILGQFSPTGDYTYNLAGGTLTTGGILRTPSAANAGATATFNFDGGTLQAARDNANLLSNLSIARVKSGGANIDTSGLNVSISQPLLHDAAIGATPDGGLAKSGAGTMTLAGENSYTGPTTATGGTLVLGKSLTTSSAVSVQNDAKVEVANDGTYLNVVKTPAITIGENARIDLKNNKLITDTPIGSFTGGAYTGVQGEVARAYNFGSWDLPGLTTSEDLAGPNGGALAGTTTIAMNKASEVLFIGDTDTATFAGQTVTGASTLAVYTYAGDVNLDGLVDAADYGVIDNWIQFAGTDGYINGDFNYDGVIDAADYGIIDNTIQLQGAPIPMNGAAADARLSAVTAVPEPASLGVIVLTTCLISRHRRRASQRRIEDDAMTLAEYRERQAATQHVALRHRTLGAPCPRRAAS